MKTALALAISALLATHTWAHEKDYIHSEMGETDASFDLINTRVFQEGDNLVFEQVVDGKAGARVPNATDSFAGSEIYSYVWPTSLNTNSVGFHTQAGILALALTSHPNFDDTPKLDENNDGKKDNDGGLWHPHWVVLSEDEICGTGGLKVRDIPKGGKPTLPPTWPGAPIYIDSPGFDLNIESNVVQIRVPLAAINLPKSFKFDGVTAALKVNADLHNPLLCVSSIYDIASGDLSLPGTWKLKESN